MKLSALILASLCLFAHPLPTQAACTGSHPNWSCANWTDLETLAEGATVQSGAVLTLAAGIHAVTSVITPAKAITIQGSGTLATTLTIWSAWAFNIGGSTATGQLPSRITNFIFNNHTATYAVYAHGAGWRIDHNVFDCRPYGAKCRSFFYDNKDGRHCPTWDLGGLLDNNTWYDSYPSIRGAADWPVGSSGAPLAQDMACQATPINLGGAAAVYFEDNTVVNAVFGDVIDSDYGGAYVARYNTITKTSNTGGDGYIFDAHPFSGTVEHERGTRSWEIYRNTLSHYSNGTMTIRGGTGVIFDNTITAGASAIIALSNDRSVVGKCDGESADALLVDSNEITEGSAKGWLCRDQIGAGKDTTPYSGTGTWPAQEKQPAYIWNNSLGDAATVTSSSAHVLLGRDYYTETSSGVRIGTAAQKNAAACTVGQAFWVTNEGTWNTKPGENQGVLYKCTDTDTWTLYYTPYTYPHPLQSYQPPAVPPVGTLTLGGSGTMTPGAGGTITLSP